jgi:hypothetical protein
MVEIRVSVEKLVVHAARAAIDPGELQRRVERELAALLARDPLRTAPAPHLTLPSARVHAASTADPAALAAAIARRVHAALQTGELRP